MNDFVLRGFCKKCGQQINWDTKENYTDCPALILIKMAGPCEPVWFLSARQMQIVFGSDEFEKWAGQENYFELCNNAFTLIVKVLEDEPFLVAKILKEAEKEDENK